MLATHDIFRERLISLSHAARRFPGTNGGECVSPSTLWRWAMKGCRVAGGHRVKLKVVRAGVRWFTTESAIAEFMEALSTSPTAEVPSNEHRSPQARRKAADAAARELIANGA
jgi:hypothetical protein